jgi:hypothetical protein
MMAFQVRLDCLVLWVAGVAGISAGTYVIMRHFEEKEKQRQQKELIKTIGSICYNGLQLGLQLHKEARECKNYANQQCPVRSV